MRQTQLKKERDRIKIALKQCSWKTCGGEAEFCTNYQTGDTWELINAFIYCKWTKCSNLNLIQLKLTINLNNF